MRNSKGGFTLLEVLGAVAILAILYTTLSMVAIRGLRSEGESRRMFEASMLADWKLSEFELLLESGEAPEIGTTVIETEEGFTVTWDIAPVRTAIFETASMQEQDAKTSNQVPQNAPLPPRPGDAGAAPFLQVELKVSGLEAGRERWVTRTIFAVDEDAAAEFAAASVRDQVAVEGEPP